MAASQDDETEPGVHLLASLTWVGGVLSEVGCTLRDHKNRNFWIVGII